jgi:CRP/FNR family transcriptional regulator, nitrogen fixation regulation protein
VVIMLTRTATHAISSHLSLPQSQKAVPAPHQSKGAIEAMGAVMPFARHSEIYGEGEAAEYLYKVVSGVVRTSKVLADGRRQIGAFYMPGDLFGLEFGAEHAFSAEAISDAKIVVIKRSMVLAMAARDSAVAQELWSATARELQRVQARVLLLIKSAEERLAGFLLEMATRGPSAQVVELPMSRQDIADYLGLTIETVSRTFTHLENCTVIAVPTARRIEIRRRSALNRLNS